MDLSNMTLFQMAGKRMEWVAQRQAVLASNIANVDTPDYLPSDLKEVDFSKELKKSSVQLTATNPMHISESMSVKTPLARTNALHILPKSAGTYREEQKKPFETSIDENGVVLEEQLQKLSTNRSIYSTVTALYKKNVNMIGASLGKNLR